jgi:hypothetical protein
LFLPLEGGRVWLARFADPAPTAGGDATGIMTLFDAARLSLRFGAGPFRSLGRISVVPRPYQFVPLIMSLRQSPERLLIADDVGVGKTIEGYDRARAARSRPCPAAGRTVPGASLRPVGTGAAREVRDRGGTGAAVADASARTRSAPTRHLRLPALSEPRRQHVISANRPLAEQIDAFRDVFLAVANGQS